MCALYNAQNTIYPPTSQPAAVDVGKPRSCREFLPHYWFPLVSKLFWSISSFSAPLLQKHVGCVHVQLFFRNLLVTTFPTLLALCCPDILRERGRRGLTIERGDLPFPLLFPLQQTNLSWNSKLDFLTENYHLCRWRFSANAPVIFAFTG